MNNASDKKPNIILLVLDTVRADHCSAWGYERQTTPFLDELAQSATLYTRAIAPSSWTLPVHLSLFTGLYPSEHGVLSGRDRPSKDLPLLAEVLRSQGYFTAGFSNNPWASSFRDLDRGFDVFEEMFRGERAEDKSLLKKNLDRISHMFFLKDNGAARTNRKIKKLLKAKFGGEEEKPFFIFVNYMEAHQVYNPKLPYHRRFGGGLISLVEMVRNRNVARQQAAVIAGRRKLTSDHYRLMVNMYDRAIAYLDSRIAAIVKEFDQRFDPDNTLLIITSDHGENFGEHTLNQIGLIDHIFSLHSSLIHVPLLVRYPQGFQAGSQVHTPVQLQDLYHMILKTLNLPGPSQGRWWQDALLPESNREYAISELFPRYLLLDRFKEDCPGEDFEPFYTSLQSIETKTGKLILYDKHPAEYYNLAEDPAEQNNLAGQGEKAESELRTILAQWKGEIRASDLLAPQPPGPDENPLILDRLRDLGYL